MKIWRRTSRLLAACLAAGALVGCATGGLSEQRSAAISAAMGQVGTPYRYGGNEPGRGLDCSGLTYYAHRAAGVQIPRSSLDQLSRARPVNPQTPRAGDLVFFQTGPADRHVGLMVDSSRFVHASSAAHQVKVSELRTPYWKAHMIGAGTYLD